MIFSTRGLVLALGLLLALTPGWLPPLTDADAWSYRQVAALKPSVPEQRVMIAELPAPTGSDPAWLAAAASRMTALAAVDHLALVVPAQWLPALRWTPEGRALVEQLSDRNAFLGIVTTPAAAWRAEYPALSRTAGETAPYLAWLPSTALLHPESGLGAPLVPAAPLAVHPAAPRSTVYPLIWHADDDVHADLAAVLAGAAVGARPDAWRTGEHLSLGGGGVNTDVSGLVMVPPHASDAVARWRVGEASPPTLEGSVTLMAPAGLAEPLAGATAALLQGETAHTPSWALAAGAALVLLLAVYAAAWLPRLGLFAGAVLTLLLVLVLVGAEAGAYLRYGIWLAWTPALAMLVMGYPLALVARIPGRRLQRLTTEREHALRRLGAYQVEHADHENAFATLRRCQPVEEVLDLAYRCATALERKRRYDQAREIFAWLDARRPDFRDVRTHLKSLEPAGSSVDSGQTLVMSDNGLAKPLIGRYEVIRELGRGATGVVYLGRDPKIGREVAIKTLAFSQFDSDDLETFKARFTREAEAAGRLSHPNIVTVYDVGEEADLAFIAMDYATGRTLAAYTGQRGMLPVGEALNVLAEVADALDYAHGQGIVHRDIKPANIIYDADAGRVKVTDFGIARVMDSSRTRTGSIVGTPSYMAPEQLTGNTVDGRTDIFSLGVTLYQLVTGEVPFRGENLAGIAYQITSAKPRAVRSLRPDLPAAVSRIVNRALQKSPDKRYQAASEMAEALRKAAGRAARAETASGG